MIKKSIDASVIFHIIKLSETWKKNGDWLTKPHGITTQQWFVLLFLVGDPNIVYLQQNKHVKALSAMELADALNVSRANVTKLLNTLQSKKLIQQQADDLDKRRKRITLTAKGSELVSTLEIPRKKFNQKMFASFSKDQKMEIIQFAQNCLLTMDH
jgi:DNA-binding MarR family transcriptional regulator